MERELEFAGPGGGVVTNFPLEYVLTAFFTRLAPGRPLPTSPRSLETRTYNWGTDQAYWTAQGDGILIAQHNFGALPGDGIDTVFHVRIGDEIGVEVTQGFDYTQSTFVFQLFAPAETIDVATETLLDVAAAQGLVFVRRSDQPRPPRPRM